MNEIRTDFSIKSVTISPALCRISRFAKIKLLKGSNNLIISNLPGYLTEDSIRIELSANSKAKIENIFSEERPIESSGENRYSEIKKETDSLVKIKRSLESEYYNLASEVNLFINKVKFRDYFNEELKPVINSKSWDNFLSLFKNRLTQNREKTRDIIFKLIDNEEKIRSAADKLNKYASQANKKERLISIILDSAADSEEEIELHYLQDKAGWYPSYTLRADLSARNIEISMFAMIKQLTGENWKNIEILLSTANPLSNCSIPDIKSKIIKEKSAEIIETPSPGMISSTGKMDDFAASYSDEEIYPVEKKISLKSETAKLTKGGMFRSVSMPRSKGNFEEKVKFEKPLASLRPPTGVVGGMPSQLSQISDQKQELSRYDKNIPEEPEPVEINKVFSIDSLSQSYKEYYNYNYSDFMPERRIDSTPQIRVNAHFLNGTPPDRSLGGYDYRYRVASLINEIPSVDMPVQIGVDIKNLDLDIVYTSIPIEKENVYLKGKFTNNGESPFPAGPAQVFVDNQFLGNIMLPTLGNNQSAQISLGIERDIKVLRKERSKRRNSGKLIGNDIVTDYTIEIELQSYKDKPVKVEIIDRIPISTKEKEIYIIDEKFDVKPIKKTKRKILVWEIEILPKEKKAIKFGYSIKHSENYRLTGSKSTVAYYESEE